MQLQRIRAYNKWEDSKPRHRGKTLLKRAFLKDDKLESRRYEGYCGQQKIYHITNSTDFCSNLTL